MYLIFCLLPIPKLNVAMTKDDGSLGKTMHPTLLRHIHKYNNLLSSLQQPKDVHYIRTNLFPLPVTLPKYIRNFALGGGGDFPFSFLILFNVLTYRRDIDTYQKENCQ